MVAIAFPRKWRQIVWPSQALRWPMLAARKWIKWELRFPVPLLGLHQLVGQYWTAEDGPLYSVSLSRVILFGDSLLCLAISLTELADRWWQEEGVPNKSRQWLAEGLLGLALLPVPRDRRRRVFIRVVRWWLDLRANRPALYFLGLHLAELGAAVGVGCYVLLIRALPSPSTTSHHYGWTYDVVHVFLFAVVGRGLLLYLVQCIGSRSKGWLTRRQTALFVGALLCVVGYVAIALWAPGAWRFTTGVHWPLGQWLQERLFTWRPLPEGYSWP